MFAEANVDELILQAIRDGCREAVKQRLTNSYNNPLDKTIDEAISKNSGGIKNLIANAIAACLEDVAFCYAVSSEVRSVLVKVLVKKFSAEIDKRANAMMSDPATRARLTLAIEQIAATK